MFVFIAKSLIKILSNIQRCTFVAYEEEIKSVFSTLAKTSKGLFTWKTRWDNFYRSFTRCEKLEGNENRMGQFLSRLHGKKPRPDNFWQLNMKDLILKNATCKCKQRTQKLADNCIKYVNHNFFYIEMTSFLFQWSLFSVITLYFCAYFKQSNILNKNAERWNYAMVGQLTYWRASRIGLKI